MNTPDVWQRELSIFRRGKTSIFVARTLTKTERCELRERAFRLLHDNDFEKVVDLLLIENKFLSWTQADRMTHSVLNAYRKFGGK